MPPKVIGASKAWGRQKAKASKGPIASGRQRSGASGGPQCVEAKRPQGVRDQGVKIRATGFRSSKVPGVKGDESVKRHFNLDTTI